MLQPKLLIILSICNINIKSHFLRIYLHDCCFEVQQFKVLILYKNAYKSHMKSHLYNSNNNLKIEQFYFEYIQKNYSYHTIFRTNCAIKVKDQLR